MLQTEQEIQVALAIKKILDEGITSGPWQANLFLKGIKKKLEEIRDEFVTRVGIDQHHEQMAKDLAANSGEMTEVYIALYQSQGGNMSKWQEVVVSLVNYIMGRPIYSNETDVQAAIRLNDRKLNHAYVVVKVPNDAILPGTTDLVRTDREGRKLISLREAAIQLKNIIRLVHASGEYKLVGNFLVKQN
ncbi:MAG: Dot/Icm secretion system protein IcmQ [Gammaproteobacteria bacterium]|nr:MAG: Dot/Icm secretion system protein IcmQ [Gammaproteobacteria bacterium]